MKFCKTEGWDRVRSARGKSGTHHDTFELPLPNGDVLRTRVSRPPDRSTYGPGLWSHILKDQLHVTEQEFWACVQDGVLPDRGSTAPEPADGVPTEVLWQLIHRVGLSADQVARLTKEEAIARLQRYWTTGD